MKRGRLGVIALTLACLVLLVVTILAQASVEEDIAKGPELFARAQKASKELTDTEKKTLERAVKPHLDEIRERLLRADKPTAEAVKGERPTVQALNEIRAKMISAVIQAIGKDRAEQLGLLDPLKVELKTHKSPGYCYTSYFYAYYCYLYAYYSYIYCCYYCPYCYLLYYTYVDAYYSYVYAYYCYYYG